MGFKSFTSWYKRQNRAHLLLSLVIGVLCALEGWWLIHDIRAIIQGGRLHVYRKSDGPEYRAFAPEEIEPWMTFDYISVIFHLPPSYLKGSLELRDPYLNLSIKRYAVRHRESPNDLLARVKEVVRAYRPAR